jgi:IS4 transposase
MKQADGEVAIEYTKARLRALRKKSPQRAEELEGRKSVGVRIVETTLGNGEKAGFMTDLREGNAEDIKRLYRERWSIEKKYHTLKNKLKFESVTGKASV